MDLCVLNTWLGTVWVELVKGFILTNDFNRLVRGNRRNLKETISSLISFVVDSLPMGWILKSNFID